MPGAAFHSFYWSEPPADIPNPSLGSSASGGYVPWQTSIVTLGMVVFAAVAWW